MSTASMKSAAQSRYHRGNAPKAGETFHSHSSSLDKYEHVTEAIGDMYLSTDDEEPDDHYNQSHRWHQNQPNQYFQSQQQPHPLQASSQPTSRYQNQQNLPVTPPQTPTKGRKSSGGATTTNKSPSMEKSPMSPGGGSPTLRVPPNSPLVGGEAAGQAFPLNSIDYESNPEGLQQELENLQALRRMSMDVSSLSNDPDLPAFNFMPSVAPKRRGEDDDASELLWVPASLHPELAPKAFKDFVESRVEQIRDHEGGLSGDRLQSGPSLRRKKSMLSRQIDTDGKGAEGFEDGADKLRRRNRSSSDGEPSLTVSELSEVWTKDKDPAELIRQLSLSKSKDVQSGEAAAPGGDDRPILGGQPSGLKRSTRTALRRGSIRRGELVAGSRRAKLNDSDGGDEPKFKLSRVQTEPIPSISVSSEEEQGWGSSRPSTRDSGKSTIMEEPKRHITTPPGLSSSSRPISPPSKTSPERLARATTDLGSPPRRDAYQSAAPSQSAPKIERKELHPQRHSSKDPKSATPNGLSAVPSPPPAPSPGAVTSQSADSNAKRPVLKRNSPASSSYDYKESAPVPPAPPQGQQAQLEVKRKEIPAREQPSSNHLQQQQQQKEVGRKSSWSWLSLGGDGDKDREKNKDNDKDSNGKKVRKVKSAEREREKEEEKERKRESKQKKEKSREREKEKEREKERAKSNEKDHARLDLLQSSIDGTKKRESLDSNSARPSAEPSDRDRDREKEKEKDKSSRKSGKSDDSKKESGIFSSIFGGSKKKQEEGKTKSKSSSNLAVPPGHTSKTAQPQTYYYTRFPIHIERAIYRLSHLKLANPRRPLLQQVLLSNFMYAYLAKVQQMQPNGQAVQGSQSQQSQQQAQQQQQQQQQQSGTAVAQDDEMQHDSEDEDYDFDDDGRDDRNYDNNNNHGYNQRTASRDTSASNGSGYGGQNYEGSYGYQDQYDQQQQQGYYQQGQSRGDSNVNGGYSDKDYDYYQSNDSGSGYDGRSSSSRGYSNEGGMASGNGNKYYHQRSGSKGDDRDYSDEMW